MALAAALSRFDVTEGKILTRLEYPTRNIYKWYASKPDISNDYCAHEVIRHKLPEEEGIYCQILFFDIDYPLPTGHDEVDITLIMDNILFELIDALNGEDICVYESSTLNKVSMHVMVPYICCQDQNIMKYLASIVASRMSTYGKWIDLTYIKNKTLRMYGHKKIGMDNVKRYYGSTCALKPRYVLEYFYKDNIPDGVKIYTYDDVPLKVINNVKSHEISVDATEAEEILHKVSYYGLTDMIIYSAKEVNGYKYYVLEYPDIRTAGTCPLCVRKHDKDRHLYVCKTPKGDHYLKCYRDRDTNKYPDKLALPNRLKKSKLPRYTNYF